MMQKPGTTFGIRSMIQNGALYVLGFFFLYYIAGRGSLPLIFMVIFALLFLLDMVFYSDIFILNHQYLKIHFLINPFKKNLIIPLACIKRIVLNYDGVKFVRTRVRITLDDGNCIDFLVHYADAEIIRFMKRVKAENIEIVHANMQDELW